MKYQTIKTNASSLYEINKSKFYAFALNVSAIDQINPIIQKYKQLYKDARHIVYAYVIGDSANHVKCFDDNEPTGTAGIPILNLLQQKNLTNILLIVVRYFGGIKLGAAGLVRAYRSSAKLVLEHSEIVDLIKYYYYKLTYELKDTKKIYDFIHFNQLIIINTDYQSSSVTVYFRSINELLLDRIKELNCEFMKYDY